MHLLAPAGEMILTPGVALKFLTSEVTHNYLFFVRPPCALFYTYEWTSITPGAQLHMLTNVPVKFNDFTSYSFEAMRWQDSWMDGCKDHKHPPFFWKVAVSNKNTSMYSKQIITMESHCPDNLRKMDICFHSKILTERI